MVGTRSVALIGGIVALAIGLTGCTLRPPLPLAPMVVATSPSIRPTPDSTPTGPTQLAIATQLVSQLQRQCTSLPAVPADPKSWQFAIGVPEDIPYQLMVNLLDDRTVYLWVTPYSPDKAVITVPVDAGVSQNELMGEWGCASLIVTAKPSPADRASIATQQTTVMPDFGGVTEHDVDSWFAANARYVTVEYDYGYDSNPDCEDSGDGDVVGQSIDADTVIENSAATDVVIEIDCSW